MVYCARCVILTVYLMLVVMVNPLISPLVASVQPLQQNLAFLGTRACWRNQPHSCFKQLGLISISARSAATLISLDPENAVAKVTEMCRFVPFL